MKPVFRGSIVYIDTETIVTDELEATWIEKGVGKIVSLTHGLDHDHRKNARLLMENRSEINTFSTAQWLMEELLHYCHSQQSRMELDGKKAVIIGYGKIGETVAGMLTGFSVDWSFHDKQLYFCTVERLKEKLSVADFVFICLPLTEETRFFVNSEFLNGCKSTAIIFSISREDVHEMPMIQWALEHDDIGGFFWDEGHVAWRTKESIERKRLEIEKAL